MSSLAAPFKLLRGLWHIISNKPHIPASLQDNAMLRTILQRRSVRNFTADEIPADVFAAIMEAARVAPSTVNLQTWAFATFTAEEWRATFDRPIPFRAPRAVIVLGDLHRGKQVLDVFPYSPLVEYTTAVMNASLAAMNMNLAAEALGVSSVMLSETGRSGLLDPAYLKEKLRLPESVFPLMTMVFGYSTGARPPMPPRLPLEAISFSGEYREARPEVMRAWLEQMAAGYKASHPGSSFEAQLQVYRGKISRAEAELGRMVFYRET